MVTETREFQSVDSSPEAQAQNKAYFEAQGVEYEAQVEEVTAPAETEEAPAAETAKEDETVDAETQAEWDAAKSDGKRKGSYAKLRAEKRELVAAKKLAEDKVRELEAKLATPAKVDEPKPEVFTEVEPEPPNPDDFDEAENPRAELAKAQADFIKKWNRWDRKKDAFEADQAKKTEPKVEAPGLDPQLIETVNARLAAVKVLYPDFDELVASDPTLTDASSAAAVVLPDGLALLYRMKKNHPAKFSELQQATSQTILVNGKAMPTNEANNNAVFLMGKYAAGESAVVTSSPPPPKEEKLASQPTRGRVMPITRREEMDPDERREHTARLLEQGAV